MLIKKDERDILFMKTTAVRLYGARDLRLESFELPPIEDTEVLLRVVSDSLCTSTYKAVVQGTQHKRVPPDIAKNIPPSSTSFEL